jgi:hypothetical protein
MSGRSNACSELTRFWLEARHGCLVTETLPVKVPYGHSDIDLVAMHPRDEHIMLPNGSFVGPRFIVETKDEHDFDPNGIEFGKMLATDMLQFGEHGYIPIDAKGVKFSMLREQHLMKATDFLGTSDFDRLFVVHAVNPSVIAAHSEVFSANRIHWLTLPDLVRDLVAWYRGKSHATTLRNSLIGDLLHLLLGYCRLDVPALVGADALTAPEPSTAS